MEARHDGGSQAAPDATLSPRRTVLLGLLALACRDAKYGAGTNAYHVIDIQGYESGAVELINGVTGNSVTVADHPILSPDGSRFAVAAASYETCEGRTQLDVWRIAEPLPVREWTVEPFDCGRDTGWWPVDVRWRSADTVSFLRSALRADSLRRRGGESDATRAWLVRRAGVWALDSASVARLPRYPVDSL